MDITHAQEQLLEVICVSGLHTRFYWTGGTLLSHYYLHHRRSFDLDFFTETPFGHETLEPFIANVRELFAIPKIPEKKIFDRWEFLIDAKTEHIRCEFVYYNGDKKRLAPCGSYRGLMIDSLPDLAANKTMACIDRIEIKDLFDIYVLLTQKKFTLKELLALLGEKFGVEISEFTFWSESTKHLKNLSMLRPYLLESNAAKQEALLRDIKYFFLDHGAEYLRKSLT